ncbi:zincin-like metallopeptidase domain-containing protein [uncultured Fusobacterium sp.]|uniref:zincin-like metallopeptidase domain-containing protein n=1 Tax=uncultured Fusobacterium sp. TaxID=159267 RepID=UPI0015A51AFE|nr:zincin-like metallopeptidase domain-containing protein [uncultured Fusobacterium sp.]
MVGKEKMSAFEKVKNHRKELVDKVIANMDKGYIWEAGWDINALRSQNPVSGAKYNGINKLSLGYVVSENNYQDPRFVTFKQAQDNNWKVKRGEHGHLCEYWIWTTKVEKENENGEKVKVEVPLDRPKVSYFTVFNMEQIEGNYPKFELPTKLSHDNLVEIANDLIASSRCPIKEVAQSRAYYSPSNDDITLPLRDSFSSSEDFLATLIHEMAHSTGEELGRQMSTGGKMSPEYAKEELVAELSSLFLKAELGIANEGKHFENHSAYLNGWNSMLKSDPNELYRASKEADKACEFIMDRYREYLKTKENIVEKAEIKTPKQVDKEITNNLVNESDSLKGLKLTFHFSENDFNIPDETTLVGKEAYDLLQKIIDFDKEQNKVQQIINKEIEEGKENTHGLSYYKTYISLSHNDIPLLKNSRVDLGDLEFGKEKEVSKALDEYLTSIPKDRINDPIEYANFSKEYLHKKITPEEIISENKEILKNINGLLFDLKKYEFEKDISEMKNINKFNENGNKHGVWVEVGEKSILECKYNNGNKIGKFTETHLMADENSPAKTQGIYRVGKLSGEIVNLYSNDQIESVKNYKAGVLLTEEKFYPNGNIKEILGYDKNEIAEFKKFYENGKIKESLEISKDNEKIHNFYKEDGTLENTKSNELTSDNPWSKGNEIDKANPWAEKTNSDKDNQWER